MHVPATGRRLRVARWTVALLVLGLCVATVVGLLLLRPTGAAKALRGPDAGTAVAGTVVAIRPSACGNAVASGDESGTAAPSGGGPQRCSFVQIRLDDGPESGRQVSQLIGTEVVPNLSVGSAVVLARANGTGIPFAERYQLVDAARGRPLLLLAVLFALAVVLLGRGRGALALLGLALSLLVVVSFLVPALLSGRPPLLTALVGASAVMLLVLLLAHGANLRTGVAILGTSASLLLIVGLSTLFVRLASLSGLSSEDAFYIRSLFGQIDLRGLLLAGIVIGALGILDDVTVTQVSTVWELRAANASLSRRELYTAALRVGRDHIASTVNTLLLAYVGASLPLVVIFSTSGQSATTTLTSSVVAEEVVRTLSGSIGLVAAVPLTTVLAALLCPAAVARAQEPADRRFDDQAWASAAQPDGPA